MIVIFKIISVHLSVLIILNIVVKKSTGKEFTQHVFDVHGKDTFVKLIADPPNTRELKDPHLYLNRIK